MGNTKSNKKDNGFIFSNPGSLKLPPEEIYHGGFSRARNPKIQKMLELIGYGESIGSGFSTILNVWEEKNWRIPDLKYNEVLNQVELKLWMLPLISNQLKEYLKELFNQGYPNFNEIQKIILLSVGIEEGISKNRLFELLNIEYNELNKNLNWLVKNKYLNIKKYHGENIYLINTDMIETERNSINKTLPSSSVRFKESNPSSYEDIIINYLENHDYITTKKVIELTNLTTRQGANKVLNRLFDKGLLDKKKYGKSNRYYLKNK